MGAAGRADVKRLLVRGVTDGPSLRPGTFAKIPERGRKKPGFFGSARGRGKKIPGDLGSPGRY